MQTGLAPEALADELASVGLALIEQLAPADLQARYYAGRGDGYRAREHFHVAAAAVPGDTVRAAGARPLELDQGR